MCKFKTIQRYINLKPSKSKQNLALATLGLFQYDDVMEMTTYTITGQDNTAFLQGLLTCNVKELEEKPLFAAACNQKGRMIANFWIWHKGDAFYIQLPKTMASVLLAHLQKYRFRSKVEFEPSDALLHDTNTKEPIWILPETSEQFTPQMIDLQKDGGVSFKKGCYLGQEIIVRTEHLGQLKRHLYRINLDEHASIKVGDEIKNADNEKMGTVVAVHQDGIFAVIEDRAVGEALTLNGNVIAKLSIHRHSRT